MTDPDLPGQPGQQPGSFGPDPRSLSDSTPAPGPPPSLGASPPPAGPPPAAAPPPAASAPPLSPGPPPAPGMSPGPGATNWYSGPLPIKDLAPRESIGSAIGRTVVKSITFLIVLFAGLFALPLLLFGCAAAIGASAAGTATSAELDDVGAGPLVAGESDADTTLALIDISGPILGEDPGTGGLFSALVGTAGYSVKDDLIRLADDDSIDGVILQMNTPGGTIFGSRAIADGVAEYQRISGRPVVAFVSTVSASGGMYAMAGADEILADHGTIIGSIGVIFGPFQQFNDVTAIDGGILGGGVTTEGGIEVEYLTAGRSKDLGNPYRPIEPAERAVLQESLDNAYAEFVSVVSDGRGIPAATIRNDLGALIYGEQQAMEKNLIDGIANRDEAFARAAELAGAEDDNWAVREVANPEPGFLELLGARVLGSETADDSAPAFGQPVGTVCLGSTTVLAYYGDPIDLCRRFD